MMSAGLPGKEAEARRSRTRPRVVRVLGCAAALVLVGLLGSCGNDYPPALMANTAPPSVRIRLGRPRTRALLHIASPKTASPKTASPKTASHKTASPKTAPQTWTVRATQGSAFAVSSAGELKTSLGVGADGIVVRGRPTGATALRVEPSNVFTLDGRTYHGALLVSLVKGKLLLVNELDMETYIAGVIGNEVGPGAKPATYRAQAVAARTYAWMRLRRPGSSSRAFHLYDSASSQVYKGRSIPKQYGIRYADMVQRTAETRGVIVTFQGRPFRTYYASTCGGHTTQPATSGLDGGLASEPLRGVPCDHCTTSKYFRWTKQVTDAEVIAGLKRKKRPVSAPLHSIEITKRGRGDWVAEATVRYGAKRAGRTVPGYELRGALGLRSNKIDSIKRIRGGWIFKGRGWGHGVGMCQWGAIEMGRKGASETEILRYYYPGSAFTKVY